MYLPVKVILDKYYFICGSPLTFIQRGQLCDGHLDCVSGEDEEHCVKDFPEKPRVAGESRDGRGGAVGMSAQMWSLPLFFVSV